MKRGLQLVSPTGCGDRLVGDGVVDMGLLLDLVILSLQDCTNYSTYYLGLHMVPPCLFVFVCLLFVHNLTKFFC